MVLVYYACVVVSILVLCLHIRPCTCVHMYIRTTHGTFYTVWVLLTEQYLVCMYCKLDGIRRWSGPGAVRSSQVVLQSPKLKTQNMSLKHSYLIHNSFLLSVSSHICQTRVCTKPISQVGGRLRCLPVSCSRSIM